MGANVRLKTKVEKLEKRGDLFELKAGGKTFSFDAVVVATGGFSYPSTGSDGKFFDTIRNLVTATTDFEPSLVSLKTRDTSNGRRA